MPVLSLWGSLLFHNWFERTAYHTFQIRTITEPKTIRRYAQDYGIKVCFEAGLPGRTTSIANVYPDLVTAGNEY